MKKNDPPTLLLTIDEVMARTGYRSRSSIYRLVKREACPQPVVIGGGRVRWRSHEIEEWLNSLPNQTYV